MRTIGERYSPAMEITDQESADKYFELLVREQLKACLDAGEPISRERAQEIERESLAYYAGYYGNETRARVERLFQCEHPVFGSIEGKGPPHPDTALAAGLMRGLEQRR